MKIINPKDIKAGMIIEDKDGHRGEVVENIHPWGFKRLQYGGLSIINHPDPGWYRLIKK